MYTDIKDYASYGGNFCSITATPEQFMLQNPLRDFTAILMNFSRHKASDVSGHVPRAPEFRAVHPGLHKNSLLKRKQHIQSHVKPALDQMAQIGRHLPTETSAPPISSVAFSGKPASGFEICSKPGL